MWYMISMSDLRNLSKTFERKLVVFDPVTSGKVYLTKFRLKHSIFMLHICQLGEVQEMFMWRRIWLDFAAEDIYTVQKDLNDLLKGRILVGHALHNDLKVIYSLQAALS